MLNAMQRDVIRTGYRAVEKSGDQAAILKRVQQLAKDFKVGEDEIYKIVRSPAGTTPTLDQTIAAAQEFGKHHGRREWTAEEVQQLKDLRAQHKGPKEIAGVLHCDITRVQAKLHAMKKAEAQARPAGEVSEAPKRTGADPAPKPPKGAPAPETHAPRNTLAPPPAEDDLHEPDPGYDTPLAKLAELEAPGINLAKEMMDLIDHLERAFSAKVGLLQVNSAAGWAACSFDVNGTRYSISLRRKVKS